jgi:hypothetical protein
MIARRMMPGDGPGLARVRDIVERCGGTLAPGRSASLGGGCAKVHLLGGDWPVAAVTPAPVKVVPWPAVSSPGRVEAWRAAPGRMRDGGSDYR